MKRDIKVYKILFISYIFLICALPHTVAQDGTEVVPGAVRLTEYVDLLKGKRVALVVNHSSMVGPNHLVDLLMNEGIELVKIFAPEHGFRGTADAGTQIESEIDAVTGLPVISLYGKSKKPPAGSLEDVGIVVFDIQDVGARFYTYISTLHYVMEACAEQGTPLLVLDRPNPNGYYIDGPVLDTAYRSFVGMHPIPVVYGMTMGELALMINGEGWLADGVQCELTIIPCENYDHNMTYELPGDAVAKPPESQVSPTVSLALFFRGYPGFCGKGHEIPVPGYRAP